LHPSVETIGLAFDELFAHGLLVSDTDGRGKRLSEDVLQHEEFITDFCVAWEVPHLQPWLAGLMGDWIAVCDRLPGAMNTTLLNAVAERALQIRQQRSAYLRGIHNESKDNRLVLRSLAELGVDDMQRLLVHALRGEVSGTTSTAFELIKARSDSRSWCQEVFRLVCRLDPGGKAPQPHIWGKCLQFLLRHGYEVQAVAAMLPLTGRYLVGEAAVLAVEFGTHLALDLFRKALRSPVPANRKTAAAVLALIDQDWSREELLAVLRESDDQLPTMECR